MKVLVIGSGGREHALAWKSAQDENVTEVFVCPGNAGTELEDKLTNIKIEHDNFESIEAFCSEENINLVIIGPEQPLVAGLADYLQSKKINVFGPSQAAAQLEGSKTFSKDFFIKYGIPTAAYESFDSFTDARSYLDSIDYPTVVKADGLAAGKGVIICGTKSEAVSALESIFKDKTFGSAGSRVVIEEFLEGEEASFIAVVSKNKMVSLATSQDHKAVSEGDVGLNTGGMGAYSPAPIVTDEINQKILDQVMKPTMQGLIDEGSPYLGFLYAGLMIKNGEIKVLEFNCRMGDPETQPLLFRMQGDLFTILLKAAKQELEGVEINWDKEHAITIVMASKDYPTKPILGDEINLPDILDDSTFIFHAGTNLENSKIMTSGGRVLGVTAKGKTLEIAKNRA